MKLLSLSFYIIIHLYFSEYKKAAKKLREKGMNVLAKVDASKEGELAKEHFIQGFPTLALFRYGEKVQRLAITIVLR